LSKAELEALLVENPDVTLKQLCERFRCGTSTLSREMKRHGLSTKLRAERTVSASTRSKHSEAGKLRVGALNPNYGKKPRPWLEGENHPLRKWHTDHPEFAEKQRGSNNPIHKVRHLYADPSYVAQLTRGIRAHVEHKTGKTYEEVYGEEAALKYKEKLRAASPARMAKSFRRPTAPELAMREMLTQSGEAFLEQHPIGYYTVDFFVPGKSLVIQVDGDYWHGNPLKYPAGFLSARQNNQVRLDRSCDRYCIGRGFLVCRVWENDINCDRAGVLTRVLRCLNDNR
jgi:very-short-patch-repair endonuclease